MRCAPKRVAGVACVRTLATSVHIYHQQKESAKAWYMHFQCCRTLNEIFQFELLLRTT